MGDSPEKDNPQRDLSPLSIQGIDLMTLRINASGRVEYYNQSFSNYFGVSKEELVGQPVEQLRDLEGRELLSAIQFPFDSGRKTVEVMDANGDLYQIKMTGASGALDVVMQNITDESKFRDYVKKYISTDLTDLSDEDLTTFKFPEKRMMSVSFTNLKAFTALCETHIPEVVRKTVNAYLEAVIRPIHNYRGTVDKIIGAEVMALFGAPKYYRDHSLRSLHVAAEQVHAVQQVQIALGRDGLDMCGCGVGISTGEMIVGSIGSAQRKDYTAMGSSVNMAALLAKLAESGQILLTENVMRDIFRKKPEDWEVAEIQPEKRGFKERPRVLGLNHELMSVGSMTGVRFVLGPKNSPVFLFEYMYAIKLAGMQHAVPIASATALALGEFKESEVSNPAFYNGIRIFGKYRLLEQLGRGGMGEVWRGRDDYGNEVAIKTLLSGDHATKMQIQQFMHEAKIMSQLHHRGICRIHEVGEFDQIKYIAMEYVEGVSLSGILEYGLEEHKKRRRSDILSEEQKKIVLEFLGEKRVRSEFFSRKKVQGSQPGYNALSVKRAVSIGRELCSAIQFAHSNGVLHRDIKPQNIIIRKDGTPVIMDFGIARMGKEKEEPVKNGQCRIYGTIEYMAPEQATTSEDTGQPADVYGLGAVIYQMLTGRKHFVSTKNLMKDLKLLQRHEPVQPKFYRNDIHGDLQAVVLHALKNRHQERYATAKELGDDLRRFQENLPVKAKSKLPFYTIGKRLAKNKMVTGWAVSILLVLAGFGIYIHYENEKQWGTWIPVYSVDFREASVDNEQFDFYDGMNERPQSPWEQGLKGMRAAPYQWCWLKGAHALKLSGDIKVVLDIEHSGHRGLMMLGINCKRQAISDWTQGVPGHILQQGANDGTLDVLNRSSPENSLKKNNSVVRTKPLPKQYRLTLQRNSGKYTCFLNGRAYLQLADLLPDYDENFSHIGFSTASDSLIIKKVEVYRLSRPQKAGPLVVGRALLARNKTHEAVDELITISEDYFGTTVAEEALVTAYPIALTGDEELQRFVLPIRSDYLRQYPDGLFKGRFWEIEALATWNQAKYHEAAEAIQQAIVTLGDTEVFSHIRLCDAPSGHVSSLMDIARQQSTPLVIESDVEKKVPIHFFRDVAISHLYAPSNRIEEISPISPSHLQVLSLPDNQISTLAELAHAPLVYLNMNQNRLTALPAFTQAPLKILKVAGNQLQFLSPELMTHCYKLEIQRNRLQTLDLRMGTALREVDASHNAMNKMVFPEETALDSVNISHNNLKRLTGLRNNVIGVLDIRSNQIRDISFMKTVDISIFLAGGNPFESIGPLESKTLVHLDLSRSQVKDFSALNRISVRSLNVSENDWYHLPAIYNKHIYSINFDNNHVSDIKPLVHLACQRISFANNKVASLRPLKGKQLKFLNCQNNPIRTLRPFLESPPDTFYFDSKSLALNVIRQAVRQWTSEQHTYNYLYARTILYIRTRNISALKLMGRGFQGHYYFHVVQPVTRRKAYRVCRMMGGALVSIQSEAENRFLKTILNNHHPAWIGLKSTDGVSAWDTGDSLTYFNSDQAVWDRQQSNWMYRGDIFGQKWQTSAEGQKTGFIIEWD